MCDEDDFYDGETYKDTEECPMCGDEGAYFNGVEYECPNCGYTWGNIFGKDNNKTFADSLFEVFFKKKK